MGPQNHAYEIVEKVARVNIDATMVSEKALSSEGEKKKDLQSENDDCWNTDFEDEGDENKSKTRQQSGEKYIKLYKGRRELYWK